MAEWRAIEGKRLIILILRDLKIWSHISSTCKLKMNCIQSICGGLQEGSKCPAVATIFLSSCMYMYMYRQLYSWVMSIWRYMTCTQCTRYMCTCIHVNICKCLIQSIISLVTVLQPHGHICYWHIEIIIHVFFITLHVVLLLAINWKFQYQK